jgi:hypothetical protein
MTLQHVVLFSWPEEPTAELAAQMRGYIESWPGVIPGIQALRFGRDLTDARTRGYQHLLYMEFDDEDDLRTYQAHPVHQEFLTWVIEQQITPLAFDYHLTDETVLLPHDHVRELSSKE